MFYWLGRRTLMADGVFANISGIVRLFLSRWSEKYFAAAFMMILQEQKYLQEAKCLLTFRIWGNQESKVRANPEHRLCAAVQLHQGIILPVCFGRNGKSWLYLPTPGDLDSEPDVSKMWKTCLNAIKPQQQVPPPVKRLKPEEWRQMFCCPHTSCRVLERHTPSLPSLRRLTLWNRVTLE